MNSYNMEAWVWLALIAMAFNVAKALSVKTLCREIDSSALVFHARLLPALALILPAYYSGFQVIDANTFWGATLVAAVLTLFASVLYVKSIQLGNLALVSPIQASVPVFMILTTYVLYGEKPGMMQFLLIMTIAASVAYVLLRTSRSRNTPFQDDVFRPVVMSFAAAALYGISTVIDRIAIAATSHGALFYAACWHAVTVVLLSFYLARHYRTVLSEITAHLSPIVVFILFTSGAFVLQQLSVQESLAIANGVTYVKAIVMLHIGISALLGVVLLRERIAPDLLVSNTIALSAGITLIASV